MTPRKGAAPPRKRRTAEEARTAILDAAERRLVESGVSGIRLQEVAADVGVSHPTILHHFGNREALVQAVVARCQHAIYAAIIDALRATAIADDAVEQLLERVFEVIERGGHARMLFWLALEGAELPDGRDSLRTVAELAHDVRLERRASMGMGSAAPSVEDTRFAVMLATLAMTAESVIGRHFFENIGFGADDTVQRRFRAWLARLLVQHLESL